MFILKNRDMSKRINAILLICMMTVSLFSCEKEETEIVKTQLFRPSLFRATANANIIHFTWTPIGGATYLIEISTVSDFSGNIQLYTIEKGDEYEAEDLLSNTLYYTRIKAVSIDKSIKDSEYYKTVTVTTGQENIFNSISSEFLDRDHVFLTWDSIRTVTHIVVLKEETEVDHIPLSPQEVISGKKDITGLTPNTEYVFRIYNGDNWLRGTQTVKTLSLFYDIAPEDIGEEHVMVKWFNAVAVTHIVVSATGEKEDKLIPLSENDNGQKDITGLIPETMYTIDIFNGETLLGSVSVKTWLDGRDILLDPEPEDTDVNQIVLRWINTTKSVTHIMVSSVNAPDIRIELSDADIEAYRATIENLEAGSTYEFRIYNDDRLRGMTTRTTLPD
jgi:hypothetical protein